jgi:hypothetical protein
MLGYLVCSSMASWLSRLSPSAASESAPSSSSLPSSELLEEAFELLELDDEAFDDELELDSMPELELALDLSGGSGGCAGCGSCGGA